jgi:hypothetical protein
LAALCWSADPKDAVLDAARQSTALSNKEWLHWSGHRLESL